MTNARVSRATHRRVEELEKERNALLDLLNGILQKAGGVLSIEHEYYLGLPRHPVYSIPGPNGVIIKLGVDEHVVAGTNKRLFVVPAAEV